MARRRINITQEIIDTSMRANSSHCMIADAVRKAIPYARRVEVDLQTIRYTDGDERHVFFTPRAAQLALIKFDQGDDDLVPFVFSLGAPTQVVKRKQKSENPDDRTMKLREYASIGGKKSQEKARVANDAAKKKGTTKLGGQLPPTFSTASNLGDRRMFGLRLARV